MNIFLPKNLYIGKDIEKISFEKNFVTKIFKNQDCYEQTIYFLNLTINYVNFPKIISHSKDEKKIIMSNCGELLNLYNLPKNWKNQLYEIGNIFKKLNYYILDLRFLPYTPYVINNICTKNRTLYVVDVTMYRKRSATYINYKIEFLIKKISIYLYFINYPIIIFFLHLIFEIYRLLEDFIEIILFGDINIIDELRNILGYFVYKN